MKYTIFISDLHLKEQQPKIFELLLRVLHDYVKPEQTTALYILGDFFNWWAGDDDLSAFNLKVIEAIKVLAQQGIAIYLLPGNRDFLLGQKFAEKSGCTLLSDPTAINLYGITTLLTHGDILCTKDYAMNVFRAITRRELAKKIFLSLPLGWRRKIADLTHRISTRRRKGSDLNKPVKDLAVDEVKVQQLLLQYHAAQIIHGHLHKQGIFNAISGKRFVLDEWRENGASALFYYEDGSYELKIVN